MTKRLSALEVLAINDLPEKARIARMAYIARRNGWAWSEVTHKEVKAIIARFFEPRGRKTVLVKLLRREIRRQCVVSNQREWRRQPRYYRCANDRGYDPVGYRMCVEDTGRDGPPVTQRWKAVITSRFHTAIESLYTARSEALYAGEEAPDPLIPQPGHWYWDGPVPVSRRVMSAAKVNGVYMFTTRPSYIVQSSGANLRAHKVRYLVLKDGDLLKAIRVAHKGTSVKASIDSLKPAAVLKAEERGDFVKPDWDREVWLVRNPKRKKWREIAFKRYTRKRRKEATDE